MRYLLPAMFLMACDISFNDTPDKNCDTRTAYYEDVDGDGLGDPSTVFIGCSAPEGWVSTPSSSEETTDTAQDTAVE